MAAIDRERVQQKLDFIAQQVSELQELMTARGPGEILGDPWLVKGVKYSLQVAIEAMIDVAYHISAKGFGHAPLDACDAFGTLAERGVIKGNDLPTFNEMIRFRNLVVHGYNKVDDTVVYHIARNEAEDFRRFLRAVKAYLQNTCR